MQLFITIGPNHVDIPYKLNYMVPGTGTRNCFNQGCGSAFILCGSGSTALVLIYYKEPEFCWRRRNQFLSFNITVLN